MSKKVFVTGATGFTGGHLARHLKAKGNDVIALAREGKDTSALEAAGIAIARGDLLNADSLARAVKGVEIVYHIAAVYREENIPRQTFFDVNVEGTRHLLKAAKAAGVQRFVHCSTVGVQGEISNPPATEEHPFKPGDYYQESKLQGELLALDFFKKENMSGAVFRPVGIYGPGDTRFLKLFKFIGSGKFRMFGSGEKLYHLTYIDDLVEGIRLMGETPSIEGEVITLAGGRYTTLNELAQTIADVLEVKLSGMHIPVWPVLIAGAVCETVCRPFKIDPPIYRRRVDFFTKDRAFVIDKAKRLLNYNPQVDLKEGLSKTADWYKSEDLIS
ncbi:NAD-dependent epimerase/dehydratase family protein [bacterium]|nr:NAD-dependent epimerase/dehydratase family protein [bacterium]